MPGWRPSHPNTPTLSTIASVEALESVFDLPDIRPAALNQDQLRSAPSSIPIPGIDEPNAVLSLAKALAIAIHHPPEDESLRKATEQGITNVLVRLCAEHPGAAMLAVDVARIAAHSNGPEAKPHSSKENLLIPVVISAMRDPHFSEVVREHIKEFL